MAKNAVKKEAICKAAAGLFVDKGFEKTSSRDIADAAGIHSSALYYYFEDKEAILYTILMAIMDESLERMREIEARDMPLVEKIHAVIALHTEIYGADPVRMALIAYNQKSLNPKHWEELRAKQKAYARITADLLARLRAEGRMHDLHPTLCAFALFGMIQSAHLWYDPRGEVTPEGLRDLFARIFTRGILTNGAEDRPPRRKRRSSR